MPHSRKRHIEEVLEKLVRFSPLVGILGHRQVGKTTLLSHFSNDYRSLDVLSERKKAESDPEDYVRSLKGNRTVIDESQLVPELFPALKERIRKNKKTGQFLLSGSVRFTSRKALRESLTGRIQYLELLPFSISELDGDPLPSQIQKLLVAKKFTAIESAYSAHASTLNKKNAAINTYLIKGGLPGVCFIREEKLRKNQILDQLQTILDRDIRQVYPTSLSYQQIFEYVQALASLQGEPLRLKELQRITEINPITQRKLLYALEAVFIIRRIPIEGGRKGFTILFEDQAESHALAGSSLSLEKQWSQLLFRNARVEFFYRLNKDIEFFQYRSLGGVTIPLALRHEDRTLGFIPIESSQPSRAHILAAQSFLKTYSDSKVVFFHFEKKIHVVSDRLISMPIALLV